MKFKINKNQFTFFESMFKDKGSAYIELEPIMDTASEAIMRQQLDNVAYEKGYKRGYAEGFRTGRYPEYVMGCDFGSKDTDTIVIAKKKYDGSIEIIKTM